jgi:DNA modification methylase
MEIKHIKISQLKEYGKNARTHPKKQIDLLAKNIERFGFNVPVLIDKNNEIIAGHGRILAMKQLGRDEVPCVKMENLSEEEVKALRLADNQLGLMSDWEMSLVIEELKGLSPEMLDLTGFNKDLIIEADEKDDEVPEAPEEPKSKLGDLYELGGHRVLCGDSTDLEAILALTGGEKVDMYLTDPPYNVAYEGKTKDALTIENDSMPDTTFRQFLIDAFTGADAVMKSGAVFYIWHADSEGYNFRGACHEIGWKVRQCLIWNKQTMVMGRQDYHWKHEPCLYGWKDGSAHLWNSDRTQTTVLNFDRPSRNAEHPTMKPVELFSYQMTNNTKGEDIVLDNFLGSGSTLIAAQKTGRICYGMELDPKYVDVIVQRYVDYVEQPKVVKNGIDETHLWKKTPKNQ